MNALRNCLHVGLQDRKYLVRGEKKKESRKKVGTLKPTKLRKAGPSSLRGLLFQGGEEWLSKTRRTKGR